MRRTAEGVVAATAGSMRRETVRQKRLNTGMDKYYRRHDSIID